MLSHLVVILICMSEPRAGPIAVSLLLSLLSLLLLLFLPLPTGSLFGATGWDQESEVVLIIGRAPRIEKSHLAVFLSRQTPGEETSRKAEFGNKRPLTTMGWEGETFSSLLFAWVASPRTRLPVPIIPYGIIRY